MDRVYSSGASASPPPLPANPSVGYPASGNPAGAQIATKQGPYWYHMIMEELLSVITAGGLTPAAGTLTQLASAIQTGKVRLAVAGGSADALTATFVPAIAALTNGMPLSVRASGANTTTTPTFTPQPGVIPAKVIVKGAGVALAPGDIAGAGHWVDLQYDQVLDKWVLLNPATGVAPALLGNFRGAISAVAPVSLSAAQAGTVVLVSPGVAITLPLAAAVPVGGAFTFRTSSTGANRAILVSGSDQIALGTGVGATATLQDGDTVTLMSNGNSLWEDVSGIAGLGNTAKFAASLGDNGYQRLPSGLIIQWGNTAASNGADITQILPVAFPNVFLKVLVTQGYTAGSGSIGYAAGSPATLSSFVWRGYTVGNSCSYIAIGR